jgi:hypothetical protein
VRFLTKVWHPNVYEVPPFLLISFRLFVSVVCDDVYCIECDCRMAISASVFCIRPSTIRIAANCHASAGIPHRMLGTVTPSFDSQLSLPSYRMLDRICIVLFVAGRFCCR